MELLILNAKGSILLGLFLLITAGPIVDHRHPAYRRTIVLYDLYMEFLSLNQLRPDCCRHRERVMHVAAGEVFILLVEAHVVAGDLSDESPKRPLVRAQMALDVRQRHRTLKCNIQAENRHRYLADHPHNRRQGNEVRRHPSP